MSDRMDAQGQRVNELGAALGRIESNTNDIRSELRATAPEIRNTLEYLATREHENLFERIQAMIDALSEKFDDLEGSRQLTAEEWTLWRKRIEMKIDTLQASGLLADFRKNQKGVVKRGRKRR